MTAVLHDSVLQALCQGCHDYRHAKEKIVRKLDDLNRRLTSPYVTIPNTLEIKIRMLKMRLQILEMLNTPENTRANGYRKYWEHKETHYSAWYKQIKVARSLESTDPLEHFL